MTLSDFSYKYRYKPQDPPPEQFPAQSIFETPPRCAKLPQSYTGSGRDFHSGSVSPPQTSPGIFFAIPNTQLSQKCKTPIQWRGADAAPSVFLVYFASLSSKISILTLWKYFARPLHRNALSGITASEPRRTLHHYYTILFILVSIATQQCDLITVQNK